MANLKKEEIFKAKEEIMNGCELKIEPIKAITFCEDCKNTFSKLQLYTTNNIVPDINLITTYETRERPLSMEKIERIITEHFVE